MSAEIRASGAYNASSGSSAIGAGITLQLSTTAHCLVRAIYVGLRTSATAGNRQLALQIVTPNLGGGAPQFSWLYVPALTVASKVVQMVTGAVAASYAYQDVTNGNGTQYVVPYVPLMLPPGSSLIASDLNLIDGTNDFAAINALVELWDFSGGAGPHHVILDTVPTLQTQQL